MKDIKLRWIETELNDNTPVAMRTNYPECGNSYFKLQQQVNGEWVDILIE